MDVEDARRYILETIRPLGRYKYIEDILQGYPVYSVDGKTDTLEAQEWVVSIRRHGFEAGRDPTHRCYVERSEKEKAPVISKVKIMPASQEGLIKPVQRDAEWNADLSSKFSPDDNLLQGHTQNKGTQRTEGSTTIPETVCGTGRTGRTGDQSRRGPHDSHRSLIGIPDGSLYAIYVPELDNVASTGTGNTSIDPSRKA
jgi:hypothetical protein